MTGKSSLIQLADVVLHSGRSSFFKLECDALTDADWDAAAAMLLRLLRRSFGAVEGVPRGGLPFAKAIGWRMPLYTPPLPCLLIVDDVWTTGGSMEAHRNGRDAMGAVLFARGPVADWVTPLFTLHEGLWDE